MRQFLSEPDRQLLQRRFRIKEPQNYPGLTERLEKGAVPVRIIHGYDETPPGGRKKGSQASRDVRLRASALARLHHRA